MLTAGAARAEWRGSSRFTPRISMMAAENTHNASGGRVFVPEAWAELVELARAMDVPLHLDGARVWNAAVAREISLEDVTRGATTIMVSFSKGLGCPVGSCLIGSDPEIDRAWEVRKRLGGGMRQTGILAAACLYALDHNLERLADDHRNARMLADRFADHHAVTVVEPETNIVMFELREGLSASDTVARLETAGVRLVEFGATRVRAVLHADVSQDAVHQAADLLARELAR